MSKTRLVILFCFLLVPFGMMGQHTIQGKVLDKQTRQPLPFVNIIGNDAHQGTSTDIDGRFDLTSNAPTRQLTFSYVGYSPLKYEVGKEENNITILLERKNQELEAVTILPGENPAERIVKLAIRQKDTNNPEKSCAFIYNSYNKLVFTTNGDSLPKAMFEGDTAEYIESVKHFQNHHIFIMESVSERKHLPPDRDEETVIASRASGFQSPEFAVLATELQSFSVYSEVIEVAGFQYVSPLSQRAIRKYVFQLEDTLWNGSDTVFVMAFRPRKGRGNQGLQGVIAFNSDNWAVQNVVARPFETDETVSYEIEQMYEKVDGQWFPVQLHTNLKYNFKSAGFTMVLNGEGRSYLRDIKIDPELKARKFSHLSLKYDPTMAKKAENLLPEYRQEVLDTLEENTYSYMDSLGKAENFDKMLSTMGSLIDGQIPIGIFDLELRKIFAFNKLEKFRMGLPLRTNDKVSKYFSVGGYLAYGFGDKEWKYGGDLLVHLNRASELDLSMSYSLDVAESGGMELRNVRNNYSEMYRMLFVSNFDYSEQIDANIKFRALKWFHFTTGARREFRWNTFGYEYVTQPEDGITLFDDEHIFAEAYAEMRFVFREKRAQMGPRTISLGSKYPVLRARIAQGFKGTLDGEFDYRRYEATLAKTYKLKGLGEFSFDISAGMVEGDVPLSKLFTPAGTFATFNISIWNTFETMRANEFIADRYAAVALRHNFGNLFFNHPKFRPDFVLKGNAGIGWMDSPERHKGVSSSTIDKGYFEAGLMIENMITINSLKMGLGSSYRFGAYHLPVLKDNFVYRVTMNIPLSTF